MRDPRLEAAVLRAAPRIATAVVHQDGPQLDRELRRLEKECGYLLARRALDAAVHCPESLKHALATTAPDFARAAVSRERKDVRDAALQFVEALIGEGGKHTARSPLRRVPVSDAVKEAFARPGAGLEGQSAAPNDAAAQRAAAFVQAKAAPHLRPAESLGDGLRNAALEAAPHAAFAAVRRARGDAAQAVLEFVGRAGVVTVDHVADKFVRANARDLFSTRRTARGFVKELVLREWLSKREFVLPAARSVPGIVQAGALPEPTAAVAAGLLAAKPVWQQAWKHVVYTTPRAANEFAVPLPPDIRRAFIPHYLRTMDACLHLEQRFEARGFEVLRITGENQLIREHFHGQVFSKGRVVPKFPDAQLLVRSPQGREETVNVEYVTKHYTPAMIAAKAEAFRGPTVWAVDSHATAAKVAAVAGSTADLLLT
jgi:hypothetical protein